MARGWGRGSYLFFSTGVWVDDDFEMIAVKVKGMDPKCTWEIIGIYRAPNEEMLAISVASIFSFGAARNLPMQNLKK